MERIGLSWGISCIHLNIIKFLANKKYVKKWNDFQFALNITMCEITRTNIVFFFTDGVMIHNAKETWSVLETGKMWLIFTTIDCAVDASYQCGIYPLKNAKVAEREIKREFLIEDQTSLAMAGEDQVIDIGTHTSKC